MGQAIKYKIMKNLARHAYLLVLLWSAAALPGQAQQGQPPASPAQKPSQSEPRTGRSYSSGEPLKKAPSSAPDHPSPVTFTDITQQSGIDFKHEASPTSQKYLPETMGAGVALLDYDNDGRLDIFFTNGARLNDPMPRGQSPDKREAKYWNRLFHQKADGTFTDVTERAGLGGEGYSMGAAAGDYDNDGRVDLFVTGYNSQALYRNNGNGTFTDVTKSAGLAPAGWATSAGWFDYNRDGRLDLFVARYIDWDFERGSIYCGDNRPGFRAYCHPDNFKGASNVLYRQRADGTFEDVSAAAKIADAEGKALGVAFADFDSDGWTDVVVANDSVRQSLYHNLGNGTFEDIALPSGVGYDENGKTFAGMGIDAGDYDNDGHPDIFITALSNETYPLFRNNSDNTFTYTTNTSGVGQITLLYSGWGMRFVDIDNDGWRDIFVAQGHVLDTIEKTSSYLRHKQPPLLMLNNGKSFLNVSAASGQAFVAPISARGAATGDLDNDGDIDIVIGVTDGRPLVLRNNGTKNHWIGLQLTGTKSNRAGLGARVTVIDQTGRKQVFDVNSAASYLSSNDSRLVVGLGAARSVRSIEIKWPGRAAQTITGLQIDRYHTIKEQD